MKPISEELSSTVNGLDVAVSSFASGFETINLEITNLISDIENDAEIEPTALKDLIYESKQSVIAIVQSFNTILNSIEEL